MRFPWLMIAFCLPTSPTFAGGDFANPEPVEIEGYADHAMEPFITCDGKYLLFNNRNHPSENTELHWATQATPAKFRYGGRIEGANSIALDGVPSLDRNSNLYFVSVRSYAETLSTIYRAKFGAGRASDAELVEGVSLKKPGMVNFDAGISPDGNTLYAVDGDLSGGGLPKTADIFIAERKGDRFVRRSDSDRLMANVNTSALEYAPAISSDGLELYFTRMSGALFWRKLTIQRAVRKSLADPFSASRKIAAIKGYVEAPSISCDGKSLYYHAQIDDRFRIFRVTRP